MTNITLLDQNNATLTKGWMSPYKALAFIGAMLLATHGWGFTTNAASTIKNNLTVTGTFTVDGVTHASVPVGTVIWFVGADCPDGYIDADGQDISNGFENIALRAVLNGSEDPAIRDVTTVVPDLRGEFIRGWDDGTRNVDRGRTLLSSQVEALGVHKHKIKLLKDGPDTGHVGEGNSPIAFTPITNKNEDHTRGLTDRAPDRISEHHKTEDNTGSETRPRNIALLACIKR
jgi:hypothetical protein